MAVKKHVVFVTACVGLFLGGCETLQSVMDREKPSATIKGLNFGDINMDGATVVFDLEVRNPYSIPLPLTNLDYDVSTKQMQLFSGKADIQRTIPASSSEPVSLPVKIRYLDFFNALKGFRPGTLIPYKAELGLSVDTPVLGNLKLPLNRTGELAVPAIPKMDQIDWKRLLPEKTN